MKLPINEIAQKMAFEPMIPVHLKFPVSLLSKIDAKASGELLNRSAWIRRTLFAAVQKEVA